MKLFNVIKRSPKVAALVAAVTGAVLVPAALLAWGPNRATFTMASPATYVTFDSITDNPVIGGDERDFVSIRESGTQNLWTENMNVQPGKTYTVRMYVHNNAASNLNLVAQNVVAKFNLPNTAAKSITVDGFIDSSNANPSEVTDQATFSSDQNFNLSLVPGSAIYENNVFTTGTALPDSLFTQTGATLGYDKLDGKIPGCIQYSGYVSFKVKPQFATNFNVTKQVRKDGDKGWNSSVAVNNGDTVDYLLGYDNTSSQAEKNVWFRDQLPAGITYVPGSTVLTDAAHTTPFALDDNLTTGTGVNIGNFAANSNAYVQFKAKVNDPTLVCGTKTYTNKVRVNIDTDLYKEATADVVVTKACAPGQTPPVLPETGTTSNVLTFLGLGVATAATVYAARSNRIRSLLRG